MNKEKKRIPNPKARKKGKGFVQGKLDEEEATFERREQQSPETEAVKLSKSSSTFERQLGQRLNITLDMAFHVHLSVDKRPISKKSYAGSESQTLTFNHPVPLQPR